MDSTYKKKYHEGRDEPTEYQGDITVSPYDVKQGHNRWRSWVERIRKWKDHNNHKNMESNTRLSRAAVSETRKRLADLKGPGPRCFLLTTIYGLLTCTIKSS